MSLRISDCREFQGEGIASVKNQVRKRRPVWLKWPEQEEEGWEDKTTESKSRGDKNLPGPIVRDNPIHFGFYSG